MSDEEAKRLCPENYPETVVTDEIGPNNMPTCLIYERDWNRLHEYSCSQPTGVFVGKRWKRDLNFQRSKEKNFILCGYDPHADPSLCTNVYYDVMVVSN